jgi:hypothetical protein
MTFLIGVGAGIAWSLVGWYVSSWLTWERSPLILVFMWPVGLVVEFVLFLQEKRRERVSS